MIQKLNNLIDVSAQLGPAKGASVALNYLPWVYHQQLTGNDTTTCSVHGNKMHVYLDDETVSRRLAIFGGREEAQTTLIKETVSSGDVVVDIGANIGYYTLLQADLVGPEGTVYAVEPSPENIDLLSKNIRENGYDHRVTITEGAICDQDGSIDIHMSDENNLHTILDPDSNEEIGRRDDISGEGVSVCGYKLDTFLAERQHPDFIRMDIEGAEASAIDGMWKTLKQDKPTLLFETHSPFYVNDGSDLSSRLERLFSLGYEPSYLVSAGEVVPEEFEKRGYEPTKIINDYPYKRGLYRNVAEEDAIELACAIPKATRAILLAAP